MLTSLNFPTLTEAEEFSSFGTGQNLVNHICFEALCELFDILFQI